MEAYLYGSSSGSIILRQLKEILATYKWMPPPPSLGDEDYAPLSVSFLDQSLLPILRAAREWGESEGEIPIPICAAISVFHQIYTNAGYFYSHCGDKNIDAALALVTHCLKPKEDAQLTLNPRCVGLGGPNPFIRDHSECKISTQPLRKLINTGGLDSEIRKFLESPTLPPDVESWRVH